MDPSYTLASVNSFQLANEWIIWNCPQIYIDYEGNKLIIILAKVLGQILTQILRQQFCNELSFLCLMLPNQRHFLLLFIVAKVQQWQCEEKAPSLVK